MAEEPRIVVEVHIDGTELGLSRKEELARLVERIEEAALSVETDVVAHALADAFSEGVRAVHAEYTAQLVEAGIDVNVDLREARS